MTHHEHASDSKGDHGHHHAFTGIEQWISRLDFPEREQEQRPAEVIANLALQDNDVIADIGAGTGYFAIRIARLYPQVTVIATDAQPEMVNYLQSQSTEQNLANLQPIVIDPDQPQLPSLANLALIVNTYHHIADRVAFLRSLSDSMASGARIAIIDYTLDAPKGPPADMRVSVATVEDELQQIGYHLQSNIDLLPNQYFLIFQRS